MPATIMTNVAKSSIVFKVVLELEVCTKPSAVYKNLMDESRILKSDIVIRRGITA